MDDTPLLWEISRQGQQVHTALQKYPIDGKSHESFDPDTVGLMEWVFLTGKAKQAGNGLAELARRQCEDDAKFTLQYRRSRPSRLDRFF